MSRKCSAVFCRVVESGKRNKLLTRKILVVYGICQTIFSKANNIVGCGTKDMEVDMTAECR